MTRREFVRALEGEMEIPEGSLDANKPLGSVDGWDSMAALLFIALADAKVGVNVPGDKVAQAKTIDDLLALLGDRLS
jgi:acyl carrier protein